MTDSRLPLEHLDDRYADEIAAALAQHAARMGEADGLMATVTPEQFAANLLAGQSAAGPRVGAYERLAGDELDLARRLAAVRAQMRRALESGRAEGTRANIL